MRLFSKGIKRGEAPLRLPLVSTVRSGKLEGADAPSKTKIPLPLIKGKGIQGIGLININHITSLL